MFIDQNIEYKFLSPDQLIIALTKVPTNAKISTNDVGNLHVADADGISIGYIDFLGTGEYIPSRIS